MPINLRHFDPNSEKREECIERSQIAFRWGPPKNLRRFTLSHYEYIANDESVRKRFEGYSYYLNRGDPFKPYNFEVYAVDKCGQKGERARLTVPAQHEEL